MCHPLRYRLGGRTSIMMPFCTMGGRANNYRVRQTAHPIQLGCMEFLCSHRLTSRRQGLIALEDCH